MNRRFLIALSVGLGALILAAVSMGSSSLSWNETAAALFGGGDAAHRIIIWEIRLPRAFAAFIAGAALGASGAALQGLFRNPLAEPGVLGISASATLTATLALYFGISMGTAAITSLAAIVGALGTTVLLALLASRLSSIITLLLVGVGISSFCGALMALVLSFAPNPFTLSDMINWTLGSVANRGWNDLVWAAPPVALGVLILWTTRRGLSVLNLGADTAHGLGVNLSRLRMMVVAGAGLATGASVALAGSIGFVGIVAPHIVRPWVGNDPGKTILPSAILAGMFVTTADLITRILPTPNEAKLGVITALIGAPIFVMIAANRTLGGGDAER